MLQGPALGAAVAALGLSNKAVYADQVQDSNEGVASGMEGGSYTEGPDLAPNAMPAAVSGAGNTHFHGSACSLCILCSDHLCMPTDACMPVCASASTTLLLVLYMQPGLLSGFAIINILYQRATTWNASHTLPCLKQSGPKAIAAALHSLLYFTSHQQHVHA